MPGSSPAPLLATADRIVEAARRLFAEHGSDAVTMEDVAAEAGVARGTVFNHFGSKHGLVEAITEQVLTGYVALLDGALARRRAGVPGLLRELFEAMGEGIAQDRRFHRAVFREIAKLSIGLDEGGPGERARQAARERLERLLERGQARGEITLDRSSADLASAIDGLVFGTITHWLYDDPGEPLRERMARAVEILLGPVECTARRAPRRPPERRSS